MFKDYDKYLSQSLRVYLFVLVIIFIMKLVGLDYFGLNENFEAFNIINNLLPNNILYAIYTYVLLYFSMYFDLSISCNNNSNKMKIYVLITYPISIFIAFLPKIISSYILFWLIQYIYIYLLCALYNKFKDLKEFLIKKPI